MRQFISSIGSAMMLTCFLANASGQVPTPPTTDVPVDSDGIGNIDQLRDWLVSPSPNLAEEPEPVSARLVDGEIQLGMVIENDPLGPQVTDVVAGSVADRIGVLEGDHLVSIAGAEVDSVAAANAVLAKHASESPLHVVGRRNNYDYHRWILFEDDATPQSQRTIGRLLVRQSQLETRLRRLTVETQNLRNVLKLVLEKVSFAQ